MGTDIGGSLRIPSSFCGLYTLRPSYERLPYDGAANALEGQESISSVAKSVSALKTFTKAILDTKPWLKDPLVKREGCLKRLTNSTNTAGEAAVLWHDVGQRRGEATSASPARYAHVQGSTPVGWSSSGRLDTSQTHGDLQERGDHLHREWRD